MGSFTSRERQPRPDDFIRNAAEMANLRVQVPDPAKDFGMYEQMDIAFTGIHDKLEELRRNQGRIGYSAQNLMSDLSKAYIDGVQRGDDEVELSYIGRAMDILSEGLAEAGANGQLAETGNRFSRTVWQEQMEAELVGKTLPVIRGETKQVPALTSWKSFKGNVQGYLYSFLDLVPELSKQLNEDLSKDDMTREKEFGFFERYLAVAESTTLHLSQERHVPGYVINNAYGHWAAYTSKLRNAYGCILMVRDKYNLRRFIAREIQSLKG